MKPTIFAANWKMHHGPSAAREFMHLFLQRHRRTSDREVWFFPPAPSLDTVAHAIADRPDLVVGAQNVYWEEKGAFTGETSVPIAMDAGARAPLVGHSERRHVFGETDEETGRKVRALLEGDCIPVLCVGEKEEERDQGATNAVVERQLSVLSGLDPTVLEGIVIAYEPVWAIGTGRNATPEDAAQVHAGIRQWLVQHGVAGDAVRVLYGGSVKPGNVGELLRQDEINGVLVGGASLTIDDWTAITSTALD